jgi:hypothetical protein
MNNDTLLTKIKDLGSINNSIVFDIELALLNLIIGLLISLFFKYFYNKYSGILDGANKISELFPLITTITILVITIVKSSLALSLGLVGALSIVRFRTPIKDPRDLGYLFLCIGTGIGLGASQTLYTTVAVIFIILSLRFIQYFNKHQNLDYKNFNIIINWKKNSSNEINKKYFELVKKTFTDIVGEFEIKRVDIGNDSYEILIMVKITDYEILKKIIFSLQESIKGSEIKFVDEINFPAL